MSKSFPPSTGRRPWKLRHLEKESGELRPDDVRRNERDYELFLQSVEADPEMRQQIHLYKGTLPG